MTTREVVRSLVQARLEGRYPHKVPKVAQPPTATNLDYIPSTLRKKRRRAPMDKLVNNNGQWIRSNEPRK
jgi:hypothetical protein